MQDGIFGNVVLISKISLPFQTVWRLPAVWPLCPLSWKLMPSLSSCDWHVLLRQTSGSVVLQLSPRQRWKASPKELGGEGVGIQVQPFEGDICLNSSMVPQAFLLSPYVLIHACFCLFVRVSWLQIVLTILSDGPGSCFHGKDIRMALASRTRATDSRQTLTLQVAFIKSVGHASIDSNSVHQGYTKWPLRMHFAFLPGSWLASF